MATIFGTNGGETIDAADGVTNGQDIIFGKAGIDKIYGLGGDDILKGGGGADELHGGSGSDTADYSDSNTGVEVSLAAGTGSGGTAEGDKLYDIENLNGSDYNDTLQGNSGDNVLFGGAGNDILKGAGGADTLLGGAGNDFINSDGVSDTVDGGTGIDTINFSTAQAGISVNLESGYFNLGWHLPRAGSGVPKNVENVENVLGSNCNDRIWGDSHDNVLWGKDGNDQIWAGGGKDTVVGGKGADDLHGQGGIDTLSYAESSAGVTIILANGQGMGGDAQGDTFDGFENITGSSHNDFLFGDASANVIQGAGGNDTLIGGLGNDVFVFNRDAAGPISTGHDAITDFTIGQDRIQIDDSIFANIAAVQSHMQQVGNAVMITFDADSYVMIQNVNMASLSASDFLFS